MKQQKSQKKTKSSINSINNSQISSSGVNRINSTKSKSKTKVANKKGTINSINNSKIKKDKKTNHEVDNSSIINQELDNYYPDKIDNRIEFLLSKEYLQNSEIQFNKHINAIQNQISNSDEVIKIQENLFKKLSGINKEITTTDIRLEKFLVRSESEDYYNFIEKYASNLNELLITLKSQVKEIEMLRLYKEENKQLKSKIQVLELDKKDSHVIKDTRNEVFKNYLVNELNSFGEFSKDFDESVFFNRFSLKNVEESSVSLWFQNLKMFVRNQFKKYEEMKSKYFFISYNYFFSYL
jgi:hypothetical protein